MATVPPCCQRGIIPDRTDLADLLQADIVCAQEGTSSRISSVKFLLGTLTKARCGVATVKPGRFISSSAVGPQAVDIALQFTRQDEGTPSVADNLQAASGNFRVALCGAHKD